MQLASVIGHTTSTVKHSSLEGWRMLIVQPLGANGQNDGDPFIAIDELGSGVGDRVMITGDGQSVREMMKSNNSPVRGAVIGIAD
jgi:ethanolamine utilization protein EutN